MKPGARGQRHEPPVFSWMSRTGRLHWHCRPALSRNAIMATDSTETRVASTSRAPLFWSKYSRNQELPISSLASIALHIGAAALLVLLFQYVLGVSREPDMS